jgi:hypothetical protein
MDIDNPAAKSYLTELCSRTQGDIGAQVSMYDVGAAIGLQKAEAGMMAEELMVQGLVELKTLSGGIGITSQGVEMILGTAGGSRITTGESLQLGNGTVLGDTGRRAVEKVLGDVRATALQPQTTFGQVEEIVIDIKTIETQMLSPNPKVAVIREVLRSLHKTLTSLGGNALAVEIDALIHS